MQDESTPRAARGRLGYLLNSPFADEDLLADTRFPTRTTFVVPPRDSQYQVAGASTVGVLQPAPVQLAVDPTAPLQLFTLTATQQPKKVLNRTMSLVSVSFTRNTFDKNYFATRIWVTGYQGNVQPQLILQSVDSPASFLLESTGETVVITGQPTNQSGISAPFAGALTTTVTLSGVVNAPPAPTIAQQVVAISVNGTTNGWQFQFNVESGLLQDVISGYWVYKASSHVTPVPPAGRFKFVPQPSSNTSVYTFQDVTGSVTQFYYYVSAVNQSGLESSLSDAQAGAGHTTTIFRPTTSALATGYSTNYSNPANVYDGNSGTYAQNNSALAGTVWSGFAVAGGSPTSIKLNIISSVPYYTQYATALIDLHYSVDSGVSWTLIYEASEVTAQRTDTFTLSTSQDTSKVQVRAKTSSGGGFKHNIYEAWIEVTV